MPLTLAQLQQQFQAGLLNKLEESNVSSLFGDSAKQFACYQRSYQARLCHILERCYPVTQAILGQPCFEQVAYAYIQLHPSQQAHLNDYGDSFASFLKQFAPLSQWDYLPAVAELEWALEKVRQAADEPSCDVPSVLAQPDWPIRLASRAILLQSHYEVSALWQAHQLSTPFTELVLATNPEYLLVYRWGLKVELKVLTPAEWQLLTALQHAQTLASLAEYASNQQLALDKLLPQLLTLGCISFVLPEE